MKVSGGSEHLGSCDRPSLLQTGQLLKKILQLRLINSAGDKVANRFPGPIRQAKEASANSACMSQEATQEGWRGTGYLIS